MLAVNIKLLIMALWMVPYELIGIYPGANFAVLRSLKCAFKNSNYIRNRLVCCQPLSSMWRLSISNGNGTCRNEQSREQDGAKPRAGHGSALKYATLDLAKD